MKAARTAMWKKLKRFWRAPLLNKLHGASNFYYRLKGLILYRLIFGKFGKDSFIRSPLLILHPKYIFIGDRVSIRDGIRLEVIRSSQTRIPNLTIGDETNIEQNVHIVCHNRIRIGNNVSITGHCAIVDVNHPFSEVHEFSKIGSRIKDEDSFVDIGDWTFIGYGSVILPNVKIGAHAVIGANSVVVADIPDYSVAAGSPAVVLKRYDRVRENWVRIAPETVQQTHES
jgi:acetyltransferase-like isoleucine patch superfamily enzyme